MKQDGLKLRRRMLLIGSAIIAGLIVGAGLTAISVTPAGAFEKIEAYLR